MVADHLSRLVPESSSHGVPIGYSFPDEQLFALVHCPWYADIVNYLVTGQIPTPPMDFSTKEEIFGGH